MDRWLDPAQERIQARPPHLLRHVAQVLVAERQEVPGDERRGGGLGQHLHPRRRRMDPQQQVLEMERPVVRDDDLPIEDAPLREGRPQRLGEFGEVAVERLQVARLDVNLVAVTEDQRSEAVPLRLEEPAVVLGQPVGGLREHGFERRSERQVHRLECTSVRASPRGSTGRVRDSGSRLRGPDRRGPSPARAVAGRGSAR